MKSSVSVPVGDCKAKPKTYLLEWLEFKALAINKLGKDVEQKEHAHRWWNAKQNRHLGRHSGCFL
jgi:hypothetical protein